MKREKWIAIAIGLLATGITVIASPQKEVSMKFAKAYIQEMEKDIKLTNVQKDSLQSKLLVYGDVLQNAREMSDKGAATQMMQEAQQELNYAVNRVIGEENVKIRELSIEKRKKEKFDTIKNKHQKK